MDLVQILQLAELQWQQLKVYVLNRNRWVNNRRRLDQVFLKNHLESKWFKNRKNKNNTRAQFRLSLRANNESN